MEDAERFARLVSLGCHDLRSPLATVYGFARTLARAEGNDDRTERYLGMIEAASEQMAELLDELGTAARIVGGRFEPALREVDTLELPPPDEGHVTVGGTGEVIETDPDIVRPALGSLALAAQRHGPVEQVVWTVDGRLLVLAPVTEAAAPVVVGEDLRDFGCVVARLAVEALGGSLAVDGDGLRVSL